MKQAIGILSLIMLVAVAVGSSLLGGSQPNRALASAPCPGADVTPAMCVSDATALTGSNVTVSIHLYQVPAAGQTGYGFNMKYPAGLTMVALGTTNSCLDSEGGVPPNNTLGAGAKTYAAACTNLPSPGTPHMDCGGAAGCTLATVVFTCSVGGTYTLDMQGASLTKQPAYADDAGTVVPIAAANTNNGTVTCTLPPTNTPTNTATGTPVPSNTPTSTATPTVTSTPTATNTPGPVPQPDVVIVKSAAPTIPSQGIVDYDILVTNLGLVPATGVLVADMFPPGTSYVGSSPGGLCSLVVNGVVCGFFSLSAYQPGPGGPNQMDIHIFLKMPKVIVDTTVTNIAQVVADNEPPANQTNNTASVDVTVIAPPPPDLTLTKVPSPTPADAGAVVTYTLHVRNIGPGVATGVVLTDQLPPQTTFVISGSSLGCGLNGMGGVSCLIGTLLPNDFSSGGLDEADALIQLRMPPNHVDLTLPNTATVSSPDEPPAQQGNDTANASVLVRGCPDINHDGQVDFADLLLLAQAWQAESPQPAYNSAADINQDGVVDFLDLLRLAQHYGGTCPL